MSIRPKTRQARHLRKQATDAERILWQALRELNMSVKVRRQHPIGSYVVDFAIPARKLAIELDGGQHAAAQEADARRTQALNERGYRVIRFWNNDVLENLDGVLEAILDEVNNPPPPLPNPLRPQGQRGNGLGIATIYPTLLAGAEWEWSWSRSKFSLSAGGAERVARSAG